MDLSGRGYSVGGENAQRFGFGNGLRPILDAEFAVNVAGVPLDGGQRDEEPLGDFLVGQPLGDEAEQLDLALAQRFDQ